MSTLAVVEEILHEALVPLSVREIVERAGTRLPSKSKTPDTVVARDLAMDIKKHGDGSLFVRTSPGRYALRTQAPLAVPDVAAMAASPASESNPADPGLDGHSGAIDASIERMQGGQLSRKPAVSAGTSRPVGSRDSAEGGGYAG